MVKVDSLKFGEITIDGKTYFNDVVIFWDGTIQARPKTHHFDVTDLLHLSEKKPDSLIIGVGIRGTLTISDEVVEIAEDEDIRLFIEKSEKAVEIFNGAACQGKKAIALIHTTL